MPLADIAVELHRSQLIFIVSLLLLSATGPLAIVIAEVRTRIAAGRTPAGFGVIVSSNPGESHENS